MKTHISIPDQSSANCHFYLHARITSWQSAVGNLSTFQKLQTFGKFVVFTIAVVFFNANINAQGQGNSQGLWSASGPDTVTTNRFANINNTLRANSAFIRSSARVDSILSAWQAFVDNILSVGSDVSVGGDLAVGGSGTLAGNFSIGQGLDVTGQTRTSTLLVNQNSVLGIAEAFKLTADSIMGGYLSTNEIFTDIIDADTLHASFGNVETLHATSLHSTSINSTTIQSDTGRFTWLNATTLLQNGNPLVSSQWTSSGSDIYFGGKVGININTPPSFPLQVGGDAAITGTVFADRIEAQSHIGIGQFRFINGAAQPGQADTIRTPAALQIQAAETLKLTSDESIRVRAAGTVEITSESDTIKLAAGTVAVGGPAPTPSPSPVALDVVGNVRVSGSICAQTLNVREANFDSLRVASKIKTNKITPLDGDSLIHFGDSTATYSTTNNSITWTAVSSTVQGFAIGNDAFKVFPTIARGFNSIAVGTAVQTTLSANNAIVLGSGTITGTLLPLINKIPNSLMVGFNSNIPTLFVGSSSGVGTTGNVGIRTTTPGANLHVNGTFKLTDGTQQSDYVLTSDADGNASWQSRGEDADWYDVSNPGNPPTNINSNIYTFGKAGIGIDVPAARLHVVDNRIGAFAAIIFNTGDGLKIHGGSGPSARMLQIDNDLGITNFLVTSGGIVLARKFKATLDNIPDYVFSDDYPLMSITQFGEFIYKYKHLPGFTSEKEFKENGRVVDLGERTNQFHELLEIYGRYIVDMDKRITAFEEQNITKDKIIEEKDKKIILLEKENDLLKNKK